MGDRWGTDDENSWVRQVEVQVGGGGGQGGQVGGTGGGWTGEGDK